MRRKWALRMSHSVVIFEVASRLCPAIARLSMWMTKVFIPDKRVLESAMYLRAIWPKCCIGVGRSQINPALPRPRHRSISASFILRKCLSEPYTDRSEPIVSGVGEAPEAPNTRGAPVNATHIHTHSGGRAPTELCSSRSHPYRAVDTEYRHCFLTFLVQCLHQDVSPSGPPLCSAGRCLLILNLLDLTTIQPKLPLDG